MEIKSIKNLRKAAKLEKNDVKNQIYMLKDEKTSEMFKMYLLEQESELKDLRFKYGNQNYERLI